VRNEKWYIESRGRNILHKVNQRKANWIGHLVRWNCLLKHVTEETIEGTADEEKDVSGY
jgi:hypothetical protein